VRSNAGAYCTLKLGFLTSFMFGRSSTDNLTVPSRRCWSRTNFQLLTGYADGYAFKAAPDVAVAIAPMRTWPGISRALQPYRSSARLWARPVSTIGDRPAIFFFCISLKIAFRFWYWPLVRYHGKQHPRGRVSWTGHEPACNEKIRC
jgi:hypothetical protein